MEVFNRRTPLILIMLAAIAAVLIGQLMSFQLRLSSSIQEFETVASSRGQVTQQLQPNRGEIYDRDGVVLAVNTFQYRVGISPSLVAQNRRDVATQLAAVLGLNDEEVYEQLQPGVDGIFEPYTQLAGNIDERTALELDELDISGLIIEPIPLRSYPQGALTSQIIGFVNYSEEGFYGIEGRYDRLLAGTAREVESDGTFLSVSEVPEARDGQSLVLTIDRDVQYLVNEVLTQTVEAQGAQGGTIIVMNPRTGEILGMQSWPPFGPEEFANLAADPDFSYNPAVSDLFEPGSIIKVVTASIVLQANQPGLDLNWTYNNTGCFDAVGVTICDSDRVAKGNVDFRRCLIESLNTCTATWYGIVGPSRVYPVLQEFGFGQESGIDLEGEAAGLIRIPGDPAWSEADFLNISYGQGIAITPLQMLTAVNAIANDGLLVQPHIVQRRYDGERVFETPTNPVARPISSEVANVITDIMVDVVQPGTFGELAYIEGYAIAGKTGTAQQPIPGGYSETASWASFVGFLPADDPAISILVMLDRPAGYWGSQTAAPAFRTLVERLVVLMEIPPDDVRLQLVANGGRPFERN
jgi:cell division protein FtsI/penicillin-binding protein 2